MSFFNYWARNPCVIKFASGGVLLSKFNHPLNLLRQQCVPLLQWQGVFLLYDLRPVPLLLQQVLQLVILLLVQYPRPVHLASHWPVPLLLVQVLQPVILPMVHCPQPALQLLLPVPMHLLPLLMPLRPLAECDRGDGAKNASQVWLARDRASTIKSLIRP